MDGGVQRMLGAGAVALGGVLLIVLLLAGQPASAGGGAGDPLYPDLLVEEAAEIKAFAFGKRDKRLRLSHTTTNIGAGPLEIYPDVKQPGCGGRGADSYVAYQVVYDESDLIASEDAVGCMFFHAIHNHYHFEDFALYELFLERNGKLKATSEKMSFCVYDYSRPRPELPGSPSSRVYNFSNCDREDGTHGISVGWADLYDSSTPGQELNVTGRRNGRYCLVAHADPTDRLTENGPVGEQNNATETRIRLNKRHATASGYEVKRLDSACRYSER